MELQKKKKDSEISWTVENPPDVDKASFENLGLAKNFPNRKMMKVGVARPEEISPLDEDTKRSDRKKPLQTSLKKQTIRGSGNSIK